MYRESTEEMSSQVNECMTCCDSLLLEAMFSPFLVKTCTIPHNEIILDGRQIMAINCLCV